MAFFSCNSKLSNHYNCEFTVNSQDVLFEQFFMFSKASVFGDTSSGKAIMRTIDPVQAKLIGKKIKNFKPEEWDKVRDSHMYTGLVA